MNVISVFVRFCAFLWLKLVLRQTMHKSQDPKLRPRLLTSLFILCSCTALVVAHAQNRSNKTRPTNKDSSNNSLERLARTVTIYRDTYGVPHVFGRTDAGTVFGFAYAQ